MHRNILSRLSTSIRMADRWLKIVRAHARRECFCLGFDSGERLHRPTCVGLRAMQSMLLSGLRGRKLVTNEFITELQGEKRLI